MGVGSVVGCRVDDGGVKSGHSADEDENNGGGNGDGGDVLGVDRSSTGDVGGSLATRHARATTSAVEAATEAVAEAAAVAAAASLVVCDDEDLGDLATFTRFAMAGGSIPRYLVDMRENTKLYV